MRNYKRKTNHGTFSEQAIKRAIQQVKEGRSVRSAAKENELSHATRLRYLKKVNDTNSNNVKLLRKYNTRQVFTSQQEEALAEYLLTCSKMCFGATTCDARRLAFQMAERNNISCPSNWTAAKMPGTDWLQGFMKRNPHLRIRRPLTIYDIAQCVNVAHTKAMTPQNIKSGFTKTGIFPFDRNVFGEEDFLVSSVTDSPIQETIEDVAPVDRAINSETAGSRDS